MSANEANEAVNRSWSVFRSAGIADDLTIIEYIARLFLNESELEGELPDRLLPRSLTVRADSVDITKFARLRDDLRSAAEQLGGDDRVQQFATLFDQHVLFRLSEMLAGGRYPTPRHIARFMHTLAEVNPGDSLADFACGSGGLLVTREVTEGNQEPRTFGVEISPEWARIARANLLLHRIPLREDSIQDGNSLSIVDESDSLLSQERLFPFRVEKFSGVKAFSRVLMNPPFGEKMDAALTGDKLGRKISRSETALITLALRNLDQDGIAGVLAPSGLLFSNNSADKALRTDLVDGNTLDAVVALPKDAFQPYSPLQTNLLLFTKRLSPEDHLTWFFQLEQDGYPSGRGRNLTQYPPPQTSDLPFVEQLWAKRHPAPNAQFPKGDAPEVKVHWISRETGCPGVVCWGINHALKSVEFIDPSATGSTKQEPEVEEVEQGPHLLLELLTPPTEFKITVKVPIPKTVWISTRAVISSAENPSEEQELEVEETEEISKQVEPSSIKLLTSPAWAAAIAFFRDGKGAIGESPRLLGVGVRAIDIQQQAYDLRPERYVITPVESQLIDSPTTLLRNIYDNQRKLAQRIDSLFGRLELPSLAQEERTPPKLIQEELNVVSKLNDDQQQVWRKICEKTALVGDAEPDNYETALHFTLEQLNLDYSEGTLESTRLTLALLECMGLIVPVTVVDPKSKSTMFAYRRVTERDIWLFGSNGSLSGRET
ncbi:N-6 DNA methylase [Phormidium tenue FACHB-886]|nr:N-6 DNA methylase [Phormidium tenue FACHB-886]